jgi:hypothetical protein
MYAGGSSTFDESGGATTDGKNYTGGTNDFNEAGTGTANNSNAITKPTVDPIPVAQTTATNAALTTAEQPAAGLVANNVSSLIDQNSPLMQRAAAKAAEQSNARGMLNSSMAVGDAQNAVLANATPIAQSDAASTNQFALTNASAANANSQFNANQTNAIGQTNTAATNDAAKLKATQDAQAALQTQQIGATAGNQANQLLQQAASQHDQQVTAIMSDPNMSSDAKNAAIATLNANYAAFQQSYAALNNIGVTNLLDFSETTKPVGGGDATPGSTADTVTKNTPESQAAAAKKQADLDASPASIDSITSTYYPSHGYKWNDTLKKWVEPSRSGIGGEIGTINNPGEFGPRFGGETTNHNYAPK